TPDPSEAEIDATVEAVLFATNTPLSPPKIAQVAEIPGGRRVIKESVARLNDVYEQSGRVFRIESIAGGYRFHTLPQYHDVLARLTKVKSDSKLSQAAMETLAIVAYRQPIIRADVEAIRGVACGEMLRSLMEKNLVKITGRAEVLGRPMLYGTTNHFLEVFGLNSLDDLPQGEELRTPPEPKEDNPEEPEPQDDQEEAPKAEPAEQREESSETENAADAQTTPYNEQTDADAEDQAADSEAEPEDRIE
ncbi:MAG: SMC-Scp complex subunit ScpB, partial [Phycisphaerae bacterium]